jgi:uncharacterized protein
LPLVAQDERQASKPLRGFAALTPEQRREISRKGGISAHEQGKAHEFTAEEAAAAGKKGGSTTARKGHDHMAAIGRRGGKSKGGAQ